MKKLFYITAFIAALLMNNAYANILISKTYVQLDARKRSETVDIVNIADSKYRYRVRFVNYKQLPDGSYQILNDDEKNMSADNLLYMSPKSFILSPREIQTVRIMRKSLKNKAFKGLGDGEYRAHLLIQEVEKLDSQYDDAELKEEPVEPKEGEIKIKIEGLMGMSIPVVYRKGNLQAESKIVNVQKVTKKDGATVLKVELSRAGDRSIRADLVATVEKKVVGILKNVAIYTENTKRFIELPIDLAPFKNKKVDTIVVTYKEVKGKKEKVLSIYNLNN